jgi:hypothetical protein
MGRLTAWWLRGSGAGRAGVITAGLLAVTAVLAVLATRLNEAWVPPLVSVAGTVPSLYVGWRALPGAGQRRARGRQAAPWDPVVLGVHEVTGGGPLPPYVRRPHDDVLDAVLDPGVAASRLVVVRGGSSTGKTRAAFEAVARGRVARWRMDYPRGEADLSKLLDDGVPAQTILWLAELRDYTSGQDGGAAVLGRLAGMLEAQDYVIVVTTMWPEHWDGYTSAARTHAALERDPAGTAGQLLDRLPGLTGRDPAAIDPARGGVIDIPSTFTPAEVIQAARTDRRLDDAVKAAASAGHDGQVAQYLAGVPDLLKRLYGPGDPYGKAVILAAMDAARLGCQNPLPGVFLTQAAVGYLTPEERTLDAGAWAGPALTWATEKLKGAVQAVQPVPHPHGTGTAGCRPADYLDRHGRSTRQDQAGPADLWEALTERIADTADLTRLGDYAAGHGLYRYAATLLTLAAAQGGTRAAAGLIGLLRKAVPQDVARAALWAVACASLDQAWAVADLLHELREAGASDAATMLADRAASHASLDNPWAVIDLVHELREAGASDAATALADRAASHASLDNPGSVVALLEALREIGASDAVTTLLAHPRRVASLLRQLREAGDSDAATMLADRAASHASVDDYWAATLLVHELREAGASDAATALADRAAAHASLHDPSRIVALLEALREAGDSDAATALADRAAYYASVDNPLAAIGLLYEFRKAGAGNAAATLVARAAYQASLDDPTSGLAAVLQAASEAGTTRADSYAWYAVDMLHPLLEARHYDAVEMLLGHGPSVGIPKKPDITPPEEPHEALVPRQGCEPDGSPSPPWTWQEPAQTGHGT